MRLVRGLRSSVRALLSHRLRVTLTVSSVAMGVAAVILSGAIGKGARDEVLRSIEAMGTNLLVVKPAAAQRLVARRSIQGLVTTLTLEDFEAIAGLALAEEAVPGAEAMMLRVKAGGRAMASAVLGTAPAFPGVRRFRIRGGRFFDRADGQEARRVAVLGARVARMLFPEEAPMGHWIRIRGVPFEVIGVLEAKGVLADGSDEDTLVVIPIRTALRRLFNSDWLTSVFVSVRDPQRMDEAAAEIRDLLRERHGLGSDEKPDDFIIQNKARLLAARQQMAEFLTRLTSGLGAVALLVGGTGILALMLLSVQERRREIGLRLAVGARPRDILIQFLAEATVLALGGWLAGAAAGALGAVAVALATEWRVAVPFAAFLASLILAGATGLGFGVIPARKAALLAPIQALAAE
jgi:putative ABC transport system permease protein